MAKKNNAMQTTIAVLTVLAGVGALNWGLIGLFNFNLVEAILGQFPVVENLVYIAVGVGGGFALWKAFQ